MHHGSIKLCEDFCLPLTIQTQTSAILGLRGSGKTNTGVVITEDLLQARGSVVIIDPLDVWWGLRFHHKGNTPGYPVVIAGGSHGDIPIRDVDGAALANFAVEYPGAPLILSLRHMRKAGQKRFVKDFAEQLYFRKGEAAHRTPLMVVIDEADTFVPQRVMGPDAQVVGAIEDLVRRGRSAGLGVLLISQRAASVNKDVLTQIELLIAHRHTSPQDREALEKWIEAHDTEDRQREFMSTLASLKLGEAWVWSPGLDVFRKVQIRERHTFDSSSTPKGNTAAVPHCNSLVNLNDIRAKLAVTIENAEQNDPVRLRERIKELEQLVRAKTPVTTVTATPQFDFRRVKELVADIEKVFDRFRVSVSNVLTKVAEDIATAKDGFLATDFSEVKKLLDAFEKTVKSPEPLSVKPQTVSVLSSGELTKYERDLLLPLIDRYPMQTTQSQLSIFSKKSAKSSAFGPTLRGLVKRGLVSVKGKSYLVTDAGLSVVPGYTPAPKRGSDALVHWINKLPQYGGRLLKTLADAYPSAMGVDEISTATNYSVQSSAFMPALRELVSLGFVVCDQNRYLASNSFFE